MKVKCPQCEGKGAYDLVQNWQGEEITTPVKCSLCYGTGKVDKSVTYTGIRR